MPKKKWSPTEFRDPNLKKRVSNATQGGAEMNNWYPGDVFKKMKSNMDHIQVTPGKWITKGK